MKVIDYKSSCTPQLNTRIMRAVESLTYRCHRIFPDGWRVIIELQNTDEGDIDPYYMLDLASNQGGGNDAPVKMCMLKRFPDKAATGHYATDISCQSGGIRIPYKTLTTDHCEDICVTYSFDQQSIREMAGEIRIAFDGGEEWEDAFCALYLFGELQEILNEVCDQDQIRYDLSGIEADPHLELWIKLLRIKEV